MKKVRRDTIRNLYRQAIIQYFGVGQDDAVENVYLQTAVKRDIHIAGKGPGQWVSSHGVLEIYCEGGIPNATDIQDWRWVEAEFGVAPKEPVTYNSDKWDKIDKYVNLGLKAQGRPERVFHEPHNAAVVAVHWS